MSDGIITATNGAVLEVTIDRPKANAIDLAASRRLNKVFEEFRDDPKLRVAIVDRPVARHLDNGRTCEVNRSSTDGTANANSMLYGAAARAARAIGYRRLILENLRAKPG